MRAIKSKNTVSSTKKTKAIKSSQSKPSAKETKLELGSGNILKNLGYKGADKTKIQQALTSHIVKEIAERGISQAEAARIAKCDRAEISRLHTKSKHFAIGRLFSLLNKFGFGVDITISKASSKVKPWQNLVIR